MYISIYKLQRIPTPSTLFSNDSSVIGRPTHSKSCHRPLTPIINWPSNKIKFKRSSKQQRSRIHSEFTMNSKHKNKGRVRFPFSLQSPFYLIQKSRDYFKRKATRHVEISRASNRKEFR